MKIYPGDKIFNGFYTIEIIETPYWNETHNRYMAHGYRWIESRKSFDKKPKLYGWTEEFNYRAVTN